MSHSWSSDFYLPPTKKRRLLQQQFRPLSGAAWRKGADANGVVCPIDGLVLSLLRDFEWDNGTVLVSIISLECSEAASLFAMGESGDTVRDMIMICARIEDYS
jgi:hypothetical protein